MIKIGALYLLLVASMAFPPLLLLSLPLLFLYVRQIIRRRRAILQRRRRLRAPGASEGHPAGVPMTNTCYCGCGTSIPVARVYADGHNPRNRWRNHDPKVPIGDCKGCDSPIVSDGGWRLMTPAERELAGVRRHAGRRLCNRCWKAAKADETRLGTRAPQRKREEVLEEWDLMRSDGVTDLTVAAKRMGMTRHGLQKALERAAKAGDPRAVRHHNDQLSGGTTSGPPDSPTAEAGTQHDRHLTPRRLADRGPQREAQTRCRRGLGGQPNPGVLLGGLRQPGGAAVPARPGQPPVLAGTG